MANPWCFDDCLKEVKREQKEDENTKEYEKIAQIFKKVAENEDAKAKYKLYGTFGLPSVKKFKWPDRHTFKKIFGDKNVQQLYRDSFYTNMKFAEDLKEKQLWSHHEKIKENVKKRNNYYKPKNASKSEAREQIFHNNSPTKSTNNKVSDERLLRTGENQINQIKL